MTGGSPADFDLDDAGRKIELVVDDDELRRIRRRRTWSTSARTAMPDSFM